MYALLGITYYDKNKLKVLLRTAVSRMSMSMNKRNNQVSADSRQVALLLQSHKDESARIKVESILAAKSLVSALEILQLMCELLAARLTLVDSVSAVPEDLEEAVASIIYCSTRIDIPELNDIAKQFAAKFGKEYAARHVNNDAHKVNPRLIDKLSVHPPDFDVVIGFMQECATTYKVEWKADLAVLETGVRDHNPEKLGSIAKITPTQTQISVDEIKSMPMPMPMPSLTQHVVVKTPSNNTPMTIPYEHDGARGESSTGVVASSSSAVYPGTVVIILRKVKDAAFPSDKSAQVQVQLTQNDTHLRWRTSLVPINKSVVGRRCATVSGRSLFTGNALHTGTSRHQRGTRIHHRRNVHYGGTVTHRRCRHVVRGVRPGDAAAKRFCYDRVTVYRTRQ